jgi:hypothetical protein
MNGETGNKAVSSAGCMTAASIVNEGVAGAKQKSRQCRLFDRVARDCSKRLTKPSGQGAASQTVPLYGKTLQRSHEGFVGRD